MSIVLAADREPKSPGALHKWIAALLGFHIPRVAPTEGQTAPFEFVSDAFFGGFERALVLASRGSSKTRCAAILNLLVSKFRPGTETVHFGAVGAQAGWGHEYLRDMLRPPWMSGDVVDALKGVVRWENGSWVRTATGHTETGVTAIRGNRGVFDEIDLWDMKLYEMAQMMLQGTESNPAQTIAISTQYNAYGLMGHLLGEADQRGMRVYRWDLFASLSRCEKCLERDCPLFLWDNPVTAKLEPLCKGRGLRADGYVPREAVVDEFVRMGHGGREWAIEKLLMEPQREHLIFEGFRTEKHTGKAPREAFVRDAPKAVGVDWGYDHPCVFTVFAEVGDRLWGIHEHGERFTTSDRRLEITGELQEQFGSELIFYCDPEQPDEIRLFCEHDLIAVACPIRSRDARHRALRRLFRGDPTLGGPRLMLDKDKMPNTAWQFATVHRDEKTGIEVKKVNDYMDSAEYAVATVEFSGGIVSGGGFMVTLAVLTLLLFSLISLL